MGGFWDSTKVYFSTSTAKLIDEETNPIADAALEATLRDVNISANIQAASLAGVGSSIRQYNRYGKSTFIDSIPTVTFNDAPLMVVSKDPAHSGETKPLDVYPVVPLKQNGVYTYDLPIEDERYITSRRILRKVSLNIADLTTAISDSPDEAKIDDAHFQFSVDVYTSVEESLEYIYEMLLLLDGVSTTTLEELDNFRGNPESLAPPENKFYVDSGENRYGFTFDVISVEQDVGDIAEGINFSSNFDIRFGYAPYDIVNTGDSSGGGGIKEYRIENSYMTIRKRRIADDPNSPVDGIVIYGIIFFTIGTAYGEEQTIYSFLEDRYGEPPPGEEGILKGISGVRIPLSPDILPGFKPFERQKIALDAMLLSFVTAYEVDLKWYETGIFKILVIVLSMYLMTLGIGPFLTFLSEASVATFLTTALVAVGAGYLIKEILKELDGILGIIVSIAVLVAASYIPGLPATFGGMSLGSQSMFLLSATTSAANTQITIQSEELQEEYSTFVEEAKVKNQELADLAKEFDTDNPLLDLVIASVTADKFAGSESFNERVTNVDTVIEDSINQIDIFYAKMLELPSVESMRT